MKIFEYTLITLFSAILTIGCYSLFLGSPYWIVCVIALPFVLGLFFLYLFLKKYKQKRLSIKAIQKELYSGALVATSKGYIIRVDDPHEDNWTVTPTRFSSEPIRFIKIDGTLLAMFKDTESKSKLISARKKGVKYLHQAQSKIFTQNLIGKKL